MSRATKTTAVENEVNDAEKLMGLTEYLNKNPKDAVITKLLKTNYGLKIMTEAEWNQTLNEILNKKITH